MATSRRLCKMKKPIGGCLLGICIGLSKQSSPVPLLKAYLKDVRKTSQVKPGNTSPGAQNEANDQKLAALEVIIKSIEEYKLEDQHSIDLLQRRILQLEKAKADQKRVTELTKLQSQRLRAKGVSYGPRVITNIPDGALLQNT